LALFEYPIIEMKEKITILLITVFSVSGIKAIPKDSVIYSFKAGVISPYCFKETFYNKTEPKYNAIHSSPFNSGFSIGLDASRKNFSCELSFDHSSFRKITHFKFNDSLLYVRDIPFTLTQFRILPQYKLIHSEISSLNIGCGYTLAYPSRADDTNDPKKSFFLYLGNGICYTINYTHTLQKRRSSFYAGIYYENLNNKPSIGQTRGKYEYEEFQNAPIYMASLGLKYRIGRK
jgi:hypothetical protein